MPERNETITSPVGIAKFPHLNKPDTKFDKDGIYVVSLVLGKEAAEPLIKKMSRVLSQFKQTQKGRVREVDLPVKDVYNAEDQPTGEVEIKFKLKALGGKGADTWEQRPLLVDSKRQPTDANVGGGSKIKVGAEIVPYFSPAIGCGVTLRLKAVQIIELVEYSPNGGLAAWEFTEEEGFTSDGETSEENVIESTGEGQYDF